MIIDDKINKLIALLVSAILLTIFLGTVAASNGVDEHYNDHSNGYANGEKPDPEEDISWMNRAKDRTRNKDN